MGAAPAEVATQLARSAEPGDREAIDALRDAAQSLATADASAAADLSKRAWSCCPPTTTERGTWSPRRWGCSTGPAASRGRTNSWPLRRYRWRRRPKRRPRFACASRRSTSTAHSGAWRRTAERCSWATSVTSPGRRHLAWLAYNLAIRQPPDRTVANEAAAAAASTGDLEATILAETTLCVMGFADGDVARCVQRMDVLRQSHPRSRIGFRRDGHVHLLAGDAAGSGRPVGRRRARGRRRHRASPPREQRDGAG